MRINQERLDTAIRQMLRSIAELEKAQTREELMGIEGIAAKAYFGEFSQMILRNEESFSFDGRNRRPPLDQLMQCFLLHTHCLEMKLQAPWKQWDWIRP